MQSITVTPSVNLAPGTYVVTFTLTGFSTVKREGLELGGSGTITVNADLKVGTVAEVSDRVRLPGGARAVSLRNWWRARRAAISRPNCFTRA